MKDKKTKQIITIVVCLMIAIAAGIINYSNYNNNESKSIRSYIYDEGK